MKLPLVNIGILAVLSATVLTARFFIEHSPLEKAKKCKRQMTVLSGARDFVCSQGRIQAPKIVTMEFIKKESGIKLSEKCPDGGEYDLNRQDDYVSCSVHGFEPYKAETESCEKVVRRIQSAKEQLLMDSRLPPGYQPRWSDLTEYLTSLPVFTCPTRGDLILGSAKEQVHCSIHSPR
jgi:hypothetical protein